MSASSPDPIKDAVVLRLAKAKPCGGREDAASLDRPFAQRLCHLAVGTEECSRRGSNKSSLPKRAKKIEFQTGGFRLFSLFC
jgi:hypothetical protein